MNDKDITWLEKLFTQHKDDQKTYLDSKFEDLDNNFSIINKKLDIRVENCKECRECLDEDIDELGEKIEESKKGATKKVVIGSIGAICASIALWTAYGVGAIEYAVGLIKLIF